VLAAACGVLVGAITPPIPVLVVLAPVGLLLWLRMASLGAWSRVPGWASKYEQTDDLAATPAGDKQAVQRALLALAEWRTETVAKLDPFGRVIFRCLQPIPADFHEPDRAARLKQ
jgi:hypothetical protein